jgi:hypothetical protein
VCAYTRFVVYTSLHCITTPHHRNITPDVGKLFPRKTSGKRPVCLCVCVCVCVKTWCMYVCVDSFASMCARVYTHIHTHTLAQATKNCMPKPPLVAIAPRASPLPASPHTQATALAATRTTRQSRDANARLHRNERTHAHTHAHTHMHTHTHTHIHICTRTHTRTYTYAHAKF